MKLKKNEKFIQILELQTYHLGLTNKGRFFQLDIWEDRPALRIKGMIFIDREIKIYKESK